MFQQISRSAIWRGQPGWRCGVSLTKFGVTQNRSSLPWRRFLARKAQHQSYYERRQQNSEIISDFSHGLVELVDRLQRTSPGIADDRDRVLREQLIENVRDVHPRWELKRRVEREPASTYLAIRKVALMWADEVEDVTQRAQCDATPPDALAKVWDELAAQRKLFSEGLAAQQHAITEVLSQQQQILSAMSSGPGPRQLGRSSEAGRGVECFHCHKRGHIRRDCRVYQRSAHLN